MNKIKVGILGATGTVGKKFFQLLNNHSCFELKALAASEKSIGEKYGNLVIEECVPNLDCRLVFSALDSSVAGSIETEFVNEGYIVSTNSSNHRMDPDVPLLIPEVNIEHLDLIRDKDNYIIANPNCSTIGLILALAPLHKKYGLTQVVVTTMQALSGAGNKASSLDIQDNILPILGEAEKIQTESLKILGTLNNGIIQSAEINISANCYRVNVSDGHLETVSFGLESKVSIEELKHTLSEFNPLMYLNLPSSPKQIIIVKDEIPQPKYDRMKGNGMSCVVGKIEKCPVLGYKLTLLSHNTRRGAAGGAILNAELLYKEGLIK